MRSTKTTQRPTTYIVTRNCCLVGNCLTCNAQHGTKPRPFGESARVEHWRGADKVRAAELLRNWSAYKSTIETR